MTDLYIVSVLLRNKQRHVSACSKVGHIGPEVARAAGYPNAPADVFHWRSDSCSLGPVFGWKLEEHIRWPGASPRA